MRGDVRFKGATQAFVPCSLFNRSGFKRVMRKKRAAQKAGLTRKMSKSELREKIMSAFADVPYPGDESIGHPEGRDDGEDVAEFLCGKHWRSLDFKTLWTPALRWMTPEAFHHYFPAFLLAALDPTSSGEPSDIFNFISVGRSYRRQPDETFRENFKNFTPAQKQVVRNFLAWMLDELVAFQQETRSLYPDDERELRAVLDFWNGFSSH